MSDKYTTVKFNLPLAGVFKISSKLAAYSVSGRNVNLDMGFTPTSALPELQDYLHAESSGATFTHTSLLVFPRRAVRRQTAAQKAVGTSSLPTPGKLDGSWAAEVVGGSPAHGRGLGQGGLCGPFQTKPFYDSMKPLRVSSCP